MVTGSIELGKIQAGDYMGRVMSVVCVLLLFGASQTTGQEHKHEQKVEQMHEHAQEPAKKGAPATGETKGKMKEKMKEKMKDMKCCAQEEPKGTKGSEKQL
jgi:hypothetical protein